MKESRIVDPEYKSEERATSGENPIESKNVLMSYVSFGGHNDATDASK